MSNVAAEQLLYDNLAALPSEEFGVINMLPFAMDDEPTRTIKRKVCESIIGLLDSRGYIQRESVPMTPITVHEVSVKCTKCSNPLMMVMVGRDGIHMAEPRKFISDIASLNPVCPHGVLTPEDHMRHMEDMLREEMREAMEQ